MAGISTLTKPLQWFLDALGGRDGERVTATDTLTLPAIWNGVSRISGHVSQLPVHVYQSVYEDGEKVGGSKDRDHQAYRLMMRRPNSYQTPIVFREQLAVHSLLEGNGRAAIVRSGRKIIELIPMLPHCTGTGMIEGEKWHLTRPAPDDRLRLFFKTEGPNGLVILPDADVLHIPGLSSDGVCGIPLKDIGRRNLAMAIAMEKRVAQQMQSGYQGGLMLEAPAGMFRKTEDAEEFLEFFEKRHNSPEKAGKTGLLREGMKAHLMAMNNKDAEMIEQRKFSRQDAALWLGLEQILGDDSSVSYNSLEQKLLAYLMNCLNRWLKRWEEEIEYKLLSHEEFLAESHYVRFNTAALLKSDYKTTVESLAQAIGATILSPNEARSKLDLNPREGGDEFVNPAITPGSMADNAEAESSDQTAPDDNATTASVKQRRAMTVLLGRLVGIECKRATDAAVGSGNFLGWMDRFYARWESKLAADIEELGGDRELATQHCEESKRRLLDCADRATPETLGQVVRDCVATWPGRVEALVTELELSHV